MIKKLKKIVSHYLHKEQQQYMDSNFCGIKLKGLKGTFREKVDKDDAWFFELSKHAEHLFDIGCNIGYMSLMAAIQKKNKSIVLADPNPEALAKAAQNMVINHFGLKTKFVSAFIGDTDGEKVKFYTVGSGAAGSMYASHAETAASINSYYEVQKLTVDTLVKQVGQVPDLIKIDVEGAEYLVLQGATITAAHQESAFFIEMHALKELPMKENAILVLNWCKDNAYKAYYLKTANELTDPETIASRGKCHLLLLPKSKRYPEFLKNIKEGSPLPNSII
jgi:FkbM family methyltransferase